MIGGDSRNLIAAAASAAKVSVLAPWIAGCLLLLVLPAVFSANSSITIMNQMAITVVFALSYNMLLGQGGMLSFGHAVYMGVGGFLCVHMMNWVAGSSLPVPLPLLPLFGGLFGMGMALIVGSFSTRKAGTIFAMISLGMGELIAASSVIIVAFFGGEEGISGDRTYMEPFFGIEFLSQLEVYYLIAAWLLISAALMYLVSRTPVGRMANAVRDNPVRAEFLGYSARWVRFYSFVAAGFFAGIAGGLFAINYEILTEENLNLITSGEILLVTYLGGAGFFLGPVIGAVVFTIVQTVISLKTEIWALYAGALFVLTVMYFPNGLAGLLMLHAPAARMGRLGLLAVPYARTLIPGAVAVIGSICLIELIHHVKVSLPDDSEMTLFWITFDSHSLAPWIVSAAMAAGGFWLARRGTPELADAWHEANTLDGGAR